MRKAYFMAGISRKLSSLLLVMSSVAFAQSSSATSDKTPEANPARPTVATPDTLTPVGYLQFENGILYATGSTDFSSRLGINQVTKLTLHPRLQFLVQSEPLVHTGLGPLKEFNPGDVLVGAQAVLLQGEGKRPTFALSYLKHVYAGSAPDIDIGTPEHSLLVLISEDLAGFHFDLNGMFNEQKEDKLG